MNGHAATGASNPAGLGTLGKRSTTIALKHVLVPTDFSKASEIALAYGEALGRAFGCALHVLNVTRNLFTVSGIEGYVIDPTGLQHEMEHAARKQLDALIGDEDRRTLNVTTVLLASDTPARAIVSYAKESVTDLIVIGTHNHHGLAHWLRGGVAAEIVRLAPCPVLIVRHPERDFVAADVPNRDSSVSTAREEREH
jgi:nucleotide-binding universal stress UspA family protein